MKIIDEIDDTSIILNDGRRITFRDMSSILEDFRHSLVDVMVRHERFSKNPGAATIVEGVLRNSDFLMGSASIFNMLIAPDKKTANSSVLNENS